MSMSKLYHSRRQIFREVIDFYFRRNVPDFRYSINNEEPRILVSGAVRQKSIYFCAVRLISSEAYSYRQYNAPAFVSMSICIADPYLGWGDKRAFAIPFKSGNAVGVFLMEILGRALPGSIVLVLVTFAFLIKFRSRSERSNPIRQHPCGMWGLGRSDKSEEPNIKSTKLPKEKQSTHNYYCINRGKSDRYMQRSACDYKNNQSTHAPVPYVPSKSFESSVVWLALSMVVRSGRGGNAPSAVGVF